MRHLTTALSALLLVAAPLAAQQPTQYPTSWDPKLLERPDVKSAMAMIEKSVHLRFQISDFRFRNYSGHPFFQRETRYSFPRRGKE